MSHWYDYSLLCSMLTQALIFIAYDIQVCFTRYAHTTHFCSNKWLDVVL